MGIFKKKRGGDEDIDAIIESADKDITVKPLDDSGRAWTEAPEQIENTAEPEIPAPPKAGTSVKQTFNPTAYETADISSKVKAEIDELKSKLSILRDMEREYGERFERITEKLGTLGEGIRENEKSVHSVVTKVDKIHNIVEDLDPRQIDIKLQKWETKVEQLESNSSATTDRIEGISKEFKDGMKKIASFAGIEAFEKSKIDFERDLQTAKQLDAQIEKNSNKVENMFIDVEEKYQDLQKLKSEFEKSTENINSVKKDFDTFKIKLEKFIKKEDVSKFESAINRKFSNVDASINSMEVFIKDLRTANFQDVKTKYPELVREFKETRENFSKLKEIVGEINNRLGKAVNDFMELSDREGIERLKESLRREIDNAVKAANEVTENFKDSQLIITKQKQIDQSVESLKAIAENHTREISHMKNEDTDIRVTLGRELKKIRNEVLIDDDKIFDLIRKSEHIKAIEHWMRNTEDDVKSLLNENDVLKSLVSTEAKKFNNAHERMKSQVDTLLITNEDLFKKIKNLEPITMQRQLDDWRMAVDKDVRKLARENEEFKERISKDFTSMRNVFEKLKREVDDAENIKSTLKKEMDSFLTKNYADIVQKKHHDFDNKIFKLEAGIDEQNVRISKEMSKIGSLFEKIKSQTNDFEKMSVMLDKKTSGFLSKEFADEVFGMQKKTDNRVFRIEVGIDEQNAKVSKEMQKITNLFEKVKLQSEEFEKMSVSLDKKTSGFLTKEFADEVFSMQKKAESAILKLEGKIDDEKSGVVKNISKFEKKIDLFGSSIDIVKEKIESMHEKVKEVQEYKTSSQKEFEKMRKEMGKVMADIEKSVERSESRLDDFMPKSFFKTMENWQKHVDNELKELAEDVESVKIREKIPESVRQYVVREMSDLKKSFEKIRSDMTSIVQKDDKIDKAVREFAPLTLKKQLNDVLNAINEIDSEMKEFDHEIQKLKKSSMDDGRKLNETEKKLMDLYSLSSSFAHGEQFKEFQSLINMLMLSRNWLRSLKI